MISYIKFQQIKRKFNLENFKFSKKKVFFKAFKNLAVCTLLVSYNIHLIHEKIEHNQSFADSVKNDYDNVSRSLSESFINILKKAEGVSKSFYADNKGYATGYGFNPTQNTEEYNREILTFAGVDQETINFILKNAAKYKDTQSKVVPEELKKIKFTPEQINKMAIFAKSSYEKDFTTVFLEKLKKEKFLHNKEQKILKAYTDMPDNQKSVLIHMVYKVGSQNLRKYNNFFKSLINYLDNPTYENKENVALHFVYHYNYQGKDMLDKRVSKIHYLEFMKEQPVAKVSTIKSEKVPEKTEKEKWNTAVEEVRQDMQNNFTLANIWKYLQKNKEENQKMQKQSAQHRKEVQEIEPIEVDEEEASEEEEAQWYSDNENLNTQQMTVVINHKRYN